MGLLDTIMKDAEGSKQAQDFAHRYEQGDPTQGYTTQEALAHHQNVAQNLSPDQYEQAAVKAFERLSPQQRKQFHQHINQHLPQHHPTQPGQHGGDDPRSLAQHVRGLHQQDPGLLGSILSGGGSGIGGILGGSASKAALGGIAAIAIKHAMNR